MEPDRDAQSQRLPVPSEVTSEHVAVRIVNPAYGFSPQADELPAARRPGGTVSGAPPQLALFSNSKPNADHLLRRVADGLAEAGVISSYDLLAKPQASIPATQDVLGRISRDYRVALLAVAD